MAFGLSRNWWELSPPLLLTPRKWERSRRSIPPANFPNPDNNNQPSADQALGQIYGDITITCPGLNSNQLLARFIPVHAYEFADPNAPNVFLPRIGFSYGAAHASELPSVRCQDFAKPG